ncbi:MAG: hypothetical protein AABX93_00015 [Nanoarchaeota archaeon]
MKSIIELLVGRESEWEIEKFLFRNERKISNPKTGNLHSTIYFSSFFPIFGDSKLLDEIRENLPIVLNPETYFFDVFGNYLVLRYEDKKVRWINNLLKLDVERQKKEVWPNLEEDAVKILKRFSLNGDAQKYFQFNPHISFSKRFYGNLVEIPKFEEEIVLYAPSFKFKH